MDHAGFYFGAATDEEDGTYRGRLRSGRVSVDVHGPRGASVDRRSSPLGRSIFRQPSPPGRGGSRSSGPRVHGFGFGDSKEPTPLDGDGYGLPAVERVYRQPNYQEAGTFGDYDVDPPPGLPQRERGEAPDTTVQAGALEPETEEKAAGPKDPNPLEVLITGMTQLQQLLLKKGDGLDLETKGLQELPKLAEYCPETGAIDFQDYLYLVEQQIGSIASGAAEWWQKTLEVAQQAYMEYQSLSPVKRLGVKAQLTGELRSERYRRLEKKVAAMLLQSLPKGVRDDLVAYRVQGVHQILYRLMVIFQPGGAQDRAQLLRQLDVADSAATPAEAVVSIRRWYRLLQRASDLGVKLPDESIQTRSLTMIVKRVSEQNSDFKFRLALARTELQVDTRPNQTSVLKYMQHLVAELEQLGSVPKKSSGSAPASAMTTATTSTPSTSTTPSNLKGLQGGDDPSAKAKAKAGATKKPCSWFGSDNGCRNGKDCTFLHSWSGLQRGERCLLCGSKKHRAKECTAGKGSGSPDRSPAGQQAKAAAVVSPVVASVTKTATTTKDEPEAQAPTSSTTSTSNVPSANKIDSAQMSEILAETNKMLKTLTAQSQATSSTAASVDPLTLIQQQLDEVRRLKTMVVKEAGPPVDSFGSATEWYEARLTTPPATLCMVAKDDVALLDSGASHPYHGAQSDQELQQAKRVAVSLATGEERSILQTREGTLLCEDGIEPPLVPMGQLVSLLGCTVKWTPTKLVVQHPVHGKLSVKIRGHCPVIPVGQALGLIAELEQARMQEFEKTVQSLQTQLKELRDSGRDQWSWQSHLEALRKQGDRSYMAGFLHRCPTFTSAPPEVLLGIPETIPRRDDDGWKMLRSMPWPRAKRKALFQSDGWVVSLFSGDVRSPGGRQEDAMRRTFWNNSLKGNDVLVEVDVTASKSFDLNQRDMVFKLLGWAALNGKIKAIVGGPPRRSYPKAQEPQTMTGQTLKEEQLLTRMVALWYMAEEGRRHAWRNGLLKDPPVKPHVAFMLEHPGGGERDQGSFFQSPMWRSFSEEELMGEVCCRMNGRPVVLGGNLDLGHLNGVSVGALSPGDQWSSVWPMEFVVDLAGALQSWKGLRNYEGVLASLVKAIPPEDAEAALDQLYKFDAASWKLHLQRDHLPYRRDCRVCVERASGRPHRKNIPPNSLQFGGGPCRTV